MNSTPFEMLRIEREELARRYVGSAERWLRKLIHHQLSQELGPNYITQGGWNKKLIANVRSKLSDKSEIEREVDATSFGEAIMIVCHDKYWRELFSEPLAGVYPMGANEARFFLTCLKDIRDDISHGHSCSTRQLEQSVCYSNDLADSLKSFFRRINMKRAYNVPLIVRYTDNRGNDSTLEGVPIDIYTRVIDWRQQGNGDLYPGDSLTIEIEIDPAFDENTYSVTWQVLQQQSEPVIGTAASIDIERRHVNEQLEIRFIVISTESWHRQDEKDDMLSVLYRVFPPL